MTASPGEISIVDAPAPTTLAEQLQTSAKKSQFVSDSELSAFASGVSQNVGLNADQSTLFLTECLLRRGYHRAAMELIGTLDNPLTLFGGEIVLPSQFSTRKGLSGAVDLYDRVARMKLIEEQPRLAAWAFTRYGGLANHGEVRVIPMAMRQAGGSQHTQFARFAVDWNEKPLAPPHSASRIVQHVLGWDDNATVMLEAHLRFISGDHAGAEALAQRWESRLDGLGESLETPVQFLCYVHGIRGAEIERLREVCATQPSRVRYLQRAALAAANAFPDSLSLRTVSEVFRWISLPSEEAVGALARNLGDIDASDVSTAAEIISRFLGDVSPLEAQDRLFEGRPVDEKTSGERAWMLRVKLGRGERGNSGAVILAATPELAKAAEAFVAGSDNVLIHAPTQQVDGWGPALQAGAAETSDLRSTYPLSRFSDAVGRTEPTLAAHFLVVAQRIARSLSQKLRYAGASTDSAFEEAVSTGITLAVMPALRLAPNLRRFLGSANVGDVILVDDGGPFAEYLKRILRDFPGLNIIRPDGSPGMQARPAHATTPVAEDGAEMPVIEQLIAAAQHREAVLTENLRGLQGRMLVTAGMHGPQYEQTLTALLPKLLSHTPVSLLISGGQAAPRANEAISNIANMAAMSGGQLSVNVLPRPPAPDSSQVDLLVNRLIEQCRSAFDRQLAELDSIGTGLSADVIRPGLRQFCQSALLDLIALSRIPDLFRSDAPTQCVGIPGRQAVDVFLLATARQNNVPTISLEPALLSGESGSALPPVAHTTLVTSRFECDAIKRNADCSRTECIPVGSVAIEATINLARQSYPHPAFGAADGRPKVVLACQSTHLDRNLVMLDWIGQSDTPLNIAIKPHPNEPWGFIELYEARVRNAKDHHRITLQRDARMPELLAGAELVVTRFSTVSLEAAGLGIPVLCLQDGDAPLDFAAMGVAMGFDSEQSLSALLESYARDPENFKARQASAYAAYLNAEGTDGSSAAVEKIVQKLASYRGAVAGPTSL